MAKFMPFLIRQCDAGLLSSTHCSYLDVEVHHALGGICDHKVLRVVAPWPARVLVP